MNNPYFLTWQEILDQLLSLLPPAWRANFTGKVLKRLLVAFSLATEQLYALLARLLRLSIIATSEGGWLRALVAGMGMETYDGVAATVNVRFSRYSAGNAITIPQGTQVGAVYGQIFETSIAAILPADALSVDVPCTCTQPGKDGEVGSGEIVSLLTEIAGIDTVRNPNPAMGGFDAESDVEIKARLPKHLESLHRGTIPATEGAILDREKFPEVKGFLTQRSYGVSGYFRGILSDFGGGDLYRPTGWTLVGNGVYFVSTGWAEINGLVAAGWPCQRFGIVERSPDGEEYWRASSFVNEVEQGNWRFCHDKNLGRLYARADGRDLNTMDISIYAGVTWRAVRELETNRAANGVFCDVLAPFVVKANVELTYSLEPGYQQTYVENDLRLAVSDYVKNLNLGEDFEQEGLYSVLALVPGAAGVLVGTPTGNIEVPSDSVFRLANTPKISRQSV